MDQDIFAEVKRIETEAESLITKAQADRETALAKAHGQAEHIRAESAEKLRTETRLLREEHESKLAKAKDKLDAEFEEQKHRLAKSAGKRTDELAGWVVERFLDTDVAT